MQITSQPSEPLLRQAAVALGAIAGATLGGLALRQWIASADIIMLYLLAVILVAYRMPRGLSLTAVLLSVAAFNFFFVEPYHTFAVANLQYLLTFVVMATVGLAISTLAARIKEQARSAREREQSTKTLYHFTQKLALQSTSTELLKNAADHLSRLFHAQIVIFEMTDDGPKVILREEHPTPVDVDLSSLQRCWSSGTTISSQDSSMPTSLYLPIAGVRQRFGVLGVYLAPRADGLSTSQLQSLEALVDQLGLLWEHIALSRETRQTHLELETERMRNAILSSVSHDLRTPLSSIMGASSTLIEPGKNLGERERREMATAIYEQSRRLNRLLENLLKMTRIEGGDLTISADWQIPAEIVGTSISHLNTEIGDRQIHFRTTGPSDLAKFDGALIELCLVNLLENAMHYSPADAPIEIALERTEDNLLFMISDHGDGVAPTEREIIFEKFKQGRAGTQRGNGLGLTICRAIAEAHHGSVSVADRPDGPGAVFTVSIPQPESSPELGADEQMPGLEALDE